MIVDIMLRMMVFNNKEGEMMQKSSLWLKDEVCVPKGSEIYGGLAGTYDYGPLGEAMRQNIMASWREKFIKLVEICILFRHQF